MSPKVENSGLLKDCDDDDGGSGEVKVRGNPTLTAAAITAHSSKQQASKKRVHISSKPSSSKLSIKMEGAIVSGIGSDGSIQLITAYSTKKEICIKRRVALSGVIIPRLGFPARRTLDGRINIPAQPAEAYGFEAFEYMRQSLIGKQVYFYKEFELPTKQKKEIGILLNVQQKNFAEELLSAGLARVKPLKSKRANDWMRSRLVAFEEKAKKDRVGMWSGDDELGSSSSSKQRRTIVDVECKKVFETYTKNCFVHGFVDYVQRCNFFKIILLPTGERFNVLLSGINPLLDKLEDARMFVESRLHQRNVIVHIHALGPDNLNALYASVYLDHNQKRFLSLPAATNSPVCIENIASPCYDIAAYLLANRYAEVSKWNLEWIVLNKDQYVSANVLANSNLQTFEAIVECVNMNDSIQVTDMDSKSSQALFLSSIRLPRMEHEWKNASLTSAEILSMPLQFEAREELRKLVGTRINVHFDYEWVVEGGKSRNCCTIYTDGLFTEPKNVSVELVRRGLARVITSRNINNNNKRSCSYVQLLEAEEAAKNEHLGIHNTTLIKQKSNFVELNDPEKCKSYLQTLKNAGEIQAIVEWVISASRFKLFLTDFKLFITFALDGLVSYARNGNDQFGDEAYQLVRKSCFQRSVTVKINSFDDRGHTFFGRLSFEDESFVILQNSDLAEFLLEKGLATIHEPTARKMRNYLMLATALKTAQASEKGIWSVRKCNSDNHEQDVENEKCYSAFVSNAIFTQDDDINIFLQNSDVYNEHCTLLKQMNDMLNSNGAQVPDKVSKGQSFAYKHKGTWCRATVLKSSAINHQSELFLCDTGVSVKEIKLQEMRSYPNQIAEKLTKTPAIAHEVKLAFITINAQDVEWRKELKKYLDEIIEKHSDMNVQVIYTRKGFQHVKLEINEKDLNNELLLDGLMLLRWENEIPRVLIECELLKVYTQSCDEAAQNLRGLWRYGVLLED